jgi:hypothetical protein
VKASNVGGKLHGLLNAGTVNGHVMLPGGLLHSLFAFASCQVPLTHVARMSHNSGFA